PPTAPAFAHPMDYAGESARDKTTRLAHDLEQSGQRAAILTLPDSICWLLNIRGADIPRNPVVQGFAILHDTGHVQLFSDPAKFTDLSFDTAVDIHHWDAFEPGLADLDGPVRLDPNSAPYALKMRLQDKAIYGDDPCVLPKARKNPVEIAGARAAHIRDGAAMCTFLAWLDAADPSTLTEIDVVTQLETCRQATGALKDISFDTICGSGPHGAIVHYRVTHDSNRPLDTNSLLLIDSGGQYDDGTTDITRTLALGTPSDDMKQAFTRVLRGMIAISMAQFPTGVTGRDLDALARMPLWQAGMDYDHGTGHGVGSYLCVHEGPQRLSRTSNVALEPGMILSNEPGYYREGAFGIRLENLIVVEPAPKGPDERGMLRFETLTYVPIDTRLVVVDRMTADEKHWLNTYHAHVFEKLSPHVSGSVRKWLERAVTPI
ncbi:MAG: aminopeptidase family protein P, partial [Pseudomonadota bacterium]